MKKGSFKIRRLINPDIKVGDKVKLIDGSGLSCNRIDYPIIVSSYFSVLGTSEPIKNLIGIVVDINQEYVTDSRIHDVYLQDISIVINGILFRSCSEFVKIVDEEDENLEKLAKLLKHYDVRQYLNRNDSWYSTVEREIVNLFK